MSSCSRPAASRPLRQFGVFGNNNIGIWTHTGESTYHSLQTQWITRFGRGSQFQTSYTLARSRANLGMTASGQLDANNVVLDNQNPDADWGRPDTGRTHIYNASLIWMLPTLEDKSKLMRDVFGDWEITTIIGAGSGQAVNVYTGEPAWPERRAFRDGLQRQPGAESGGGRIVQAERWS